MKNVTLRFILPGATGIRQGMTKNDKRLKYAMNDEFAVVDSNRERQLGYHYVYETIPPGLRRIQ
jgi:hypothetical protein